MSRTESDILQFILHQLADATTRTVQDILAILDEDSSDSESEAGETSNRLSDSKATPTTVSCDLRSWFLSNLANPYPTLAQKRVWAETMGTSARNIDSQLTNWRRRAGWSDIKKKWGNNSKDGMIDLIARYDRGEETRPEVLAAIAATKAYFKETEAGNWVDELSSSRPIRSMPKRKSDTATAAPVTFRKLHSAAGQRSFSSSSSASISTVSSFNSELSTTIVFEQNSRPAESNDDISSRPNKRSRLSHHQPPRPPPVSRPTSLLCSPTSPRDPPRPRSAIPAVVAIPTAAAALSPPAGASSLYPVISSLTAHQLLAADRPDDIQYPKVPPLPAWAYGDAQSTTSISNFHTDDVGSESLGAAPPTPSVLIPDLEVFLSPDRFDNV